MTSRRSAALILAAVLSVTGLATGSAQAAARQFGDCNAMHAVYPNGVSKTAKPSPFPFWVKIRPPVADAATYAANKRLDRDNDGIACEVAR
jgi:hypothetical protein